MNLIENIQLNELSDKLKVLGNKSEHRLHDLTDGLNSAIYLHKQTFNNNFELLISEVDDKINGSQLTVLKTTDKH